MGALALTVARAAGFKVISGIEDESKYPAAFNFAVSLAVQTGVQSVPQVFLQATALVAVSASERLYGQYVSLVWAVFNITHTFLSVTCAMEASKRYRATEPDYYGMILRSRECATLCAFGLFMLGYLCSKVLAVAILGSVSFTTIAACFAGECAALLLIRVAIGNWRLYLPIGDRAWASLLFHIGNYLNMLAAPLPVLR